jgi:hypothetical protein
MDVFVQKAFTHGKLPTEYQKLGRNPLFKGTFLCSDKAIIPPEKILY